MVLSMSDCKELEALWSPAFLWAPEASRDGAGGGEREPSQDKATQGAVVQPAQTASSGSTDALHRKAPSSYSDLACKTMKSSDNFSNGLSDSFINSFGFAPSLWICFNFSKHH